MPQLIMSELGCRDRNFLTHNEVGFDGLGHHTGFTGVSVDQGMPLEPKNNKGTLPNNRMQHEHRPREMFVELHELDRFEMQWKENARWIKYEQNAEGSSDRWGRPHIAHLSFQSLVELKKNLEKGSLLLDIEETDLSGICHRIADDLVKSGQMADCSKAEVLKSLLYEHRHVGTGQGLLRGMSRMSSRMRRSASFSRNSRRRLTRNRSRSQGPCLLPESSQTNLSDTNTLVGLPTEETGSRGTGRDVTVHFSNSGEHDVRMPIANGASEAPPIPKRHNGPAIVVNEGGPDMEDVIRLGIPAGAEAATVLVGQLHGLAKPVVSVVRLANRAQMPGLTEVPISVRFLFVLLGPIGGKTDYNELGRCFGTLMSSENFSEIAYNANSMKQLISGMNDFIDDTIVLPAGNWDKDLLLPVLRIQNEKVRERKLRQELQMKWGGVDHKQPICTQDSVTSMKMSIGNSSKEIDPLVRTRYPFGGLVNDIKRRYPHYLSDFRDALNGQCIAAVVFIFFAALSPAITFGGLIGEKTDNWMGISEMIVGTSICGIVFALFSGQPLNIVGVTGPILVFEENLYTFCKSTEIEYLPFRFWVGFWMFIIAIICVAAEGSVLVRFFTRFTEDIFSFLISVIFIYEVFNKLYQIFEAHPLEESFCNETIVDETIVSQYLADLNGTFWGPVTGGIGTTMQAATTNGLATSLAGGLATTASAAAASAAPTMPTASYPRFNLFTDNAPAAATTIDATRYLMTTVYNASWGNGSDANVCGGKTETLSNQPNTALLSTILMLGTFLLANAFKIFKTSHYMGKTARKLVADFGIPLSIFIMVGKDLLITTVYTQKLDVPNGLVPTDGCKRGWFVNPLGMAKPMDIMWIFAAIIPALLAFILMFMESLITALIVNKKDNKLKKGSGFHLDILILGGLAAFNALFGLPWVWAATVRSVTHQGALTVYSKGAPGEKPKLEFVREQRVTALLVSLLIGLSIALAPLLKQVPLAVLFGVFLYMGVSSLNGVQFADRFFMMFMPVKHHADEPYVREVRTWRMHLFTGIQLCCVAMLWGVKISPAALAFPFFLIILVPIRGQMKRIFTEQELKALDGHGEPDDASTEMIDTN